MNRQLEHPLYANRLHRGRIDSLFEEAFGENTLIMVVAGAGYGKTQAARMYFENAPHSTTWVQLTRLDNLPTRFWENLIRALSINHGVLANHMKELGFPDTNFKFYQFLQHLSHTIYSLDKEVVFVLDDIHLITDPHVEEFVDNLIKANLENFHIVLISRKYLRYDLREKTVYIMTDQLRFTKDETRQYLQSNGIQVYKDELDTIYEYVQGWPLALYLVSLSLKQAGFHGQASLDSSRMLINTMIDHEIFMHYTEEEQDLLVELSIINSFPRGLIIALAGDRVEALENILQSTMFIQYDDSAQRFYFHNLFVDFLRAQQRGISQERKLWVYRTAADWCIENNQKYDALYYLEKCKDYEQMWKIIQSFPAGRQPEEQANNSMRYIESFPQEFVEEHLLCRIVYAMLLVNNTRFAEAHTVITSVREKLLAMPESEERNALLGEAYLMSGSISMVRRTFEFVEFFPKAKELLPNGSRRWTKGLDTVEFGYAIILMDPKDGTPEEALALMNQAVPLLPDLMKGGGYGYMDLAEAEYHFLTGDYKMTMQKAYETMHKAELMDQYDIAGSALFLLLRVYILQGDYKNILAIFDEIERRESRIEYTAQGILDLSKGWLYSEVGHYDEIAGWIMDDAKNSHAPISTERQYIVRGRCFVGQDRYFELYALMNYLEAISIERRSWITVLYSRIYKAIALYNLNDLQGAIDCVRDAYEIAKPMGFITPFVEIGTKLRVIIDNIKRQDYLDFDPEWIDMVYTKTTTYIKRNAFVLSQFEKDEFFVPQKVYDLTLREQELVRNLSHGLTREEIADSMEISINTVKSMIKNIYSKLGAINSADAIRIATNAGII